MDFTRFDLEAEKLGCNILKDEAMRRHTTFKIGGPADRLLQVENTAQLKSLLRILKEDKIPFFIGGNGSNLLVSDKGIRGAVLLLSGDFKAIRKIGDCEICAGAGASLASFCAFARDNGLSGMEFAWGIPGTVGGAAYMNAGAYGGEMVQVVTEVRHVNTDGETGEYAGESLRFGYRKSAYTNSNKIITDIYIKLEKADKAEISAKMDELMAKRKDKQPYDMPSAGSVFKRPEGAFAAALIEECGLKGLTVGGAQVSEKHSGFIINTGIASCEDVLNLIEMIKDKVKTQKGIMLECEVKVIGEE